MLGRLLLVAVFTVLAVLAFACGDDDGGNQPTASARTATPSRAAPTPSGDQKTPIQETETPQATETSGVTDTPPPTASEGTLAPLIENVSAFFAQFQTPPQDERMCAYNPSTRAIDCSARGLYAPAPPPVGQAIDCFLMTVDQKPVTIRCEIAEPQGTTYYDIRS